jgi:hypothetical protein
MWFDRVTVVSYPNDLPAGAGSISWTLPAGEGIVTTTAKFVDRAENVSPDVTLAVTVTDDKPPGGWQGFQCAGATCTVLVRDVIAGLNVHSAAYRFAADGGSTWGDWLPATCTGVDGSHDWQTIAISEPDASMVQFRIYDVAAVPNEGQSPEYGKWSIYLPVVLRNR